MPLDLGLAIQGVKSLIPGTTEYNNRIAQNEQSKMNLEQTHKWVASGGSFEDPSKVPVSVLKELVTYGQAKNLLSEADLNTATRDFQKAQTARTTQTTGAEKKTYDLFGGATPEGGEAAARIKEIDAQRGLIGAQTTGINQRNTAEQQGYQSLGGVSPEAYQAKTQNTHGSAQLDLEKAKNAVTMAYEIGLLPDDQKLKVMQAAHDMDPSLFGDILAKHGAQLAANRNAAASLLSGMNKPAAGQKPTSTQVEDAYKQREGSAGLMRELGRKPGEKFLDEQYSRPGLDSAFQKVEKAGSWLKKVWDHVGGMQTAQGGQSATAGIGLGTSMPFSASAPSAPQQPALPVQRLPDDFFAPIHPMRPMADSNDEYNLLLKLAGGQQ